jgi:hypothetical protein
MCLRVSHVVAHLVSPSGLNPFVQQAQSCTRRVGTHLLRSVCEITRHHRGQQQRTGERRFGFALEHGVDALPATPVLGHGCDNLICQRIDTAHVQAFSHVLNRREWPRPGAA